MASGTDTDRRRREILAAAMEAFDASGYAATTMEAVAARAGISKGSVYNYFQSKQDLFEHVFTDSVASDEADVARLINRTCPATEKLLAYIDYWAQGLQRYRRIGKLLLEIWATAAREPENAKLAWSMHSLYDRGQERMERIIAEGVRNGEFCAELDASVAAGLILAAMDGMLVQAIVLGHEFGPAYWEAFRRAVLAAILADPPAMPDDAKGNNHA